MCWYGICACDIGVADRCGVQGQVLNMEEQVCVWVRCRGGQVRRGKGVWVSGVSNQV